MINGNYLSGFNQWGMAYSDVFKMFKFPGTNLIWAKCNLRFCSEEEDPRCITVRGNVDVIQGFWCYFLCLSPVLFFDDGDIILIVVLLSFSDAPSHQDFIKNKENWWEIGNDMIKMHDYKGVTHASILSSLKIISPWTFFLKIPIWSSKSQLSKVAFSVRFSMRQKLLTE